MGLLDAPLTKIKIVDSDDNEIDVDASGRLTVRLVDATGDEVDISATGGISVFLDKGATNTRSVSAPTTSTGSTIAVAANADRQSLVIQNAGNVDVYISGQTGVTTANGFLLGPREVFVDNAYRGDWYFVTSSGTGDVRIMEVT